MCVDKEYGNKRKRGLAFIKYCHVQGGTRDENDGF
jgi:hypothetical protein